MVLSVINSVYGFRYPFIQTLHRLRAFINHTEDSTTILFVYITCFKYFEESSDRHLAIAQSREECYFETPGNSKISEILLLPDSIGLMMALINCSNA